MTIEEKRKALDAKCATYELCSECPLEQCFCGRGKYFTEPADDSGYMDDAEITQAYNLMFPTTNAVEHPGHYNREGAMECIDEMTLIFGVEETMIFCKLNAWKYRYRAADKGGLEDLKKSDWYLAKYKELQGKLPMMKMWDGHADTNCRCVSIPKKDGEVL